MAYGGKEFTEKRERAARSRFATAADVFHFGASVFLIVLGALMIAEGILGALNGSSLFFPDVNRGFEFIIGLVTIIVGASLMPAEKGTAR